MCSVWLDVALQWSSEPRDSLILVNDTALIHPRLAGQTPLGWVSCIVLSPGGWGILGTSCYLEQRGLLHVRGEQMFQPLVLSPIKWGWEHCVEKVKWNKTIQLSMIPEWAGCTISGYQDCGPDGVPSYLYFRDAETRADSKGRYVETGL